MRASAAETVLLVVAANFPDADLVLGLLGPEVYLLWHRGLTHSVLGLLIFPPALAFLAHALVPRLRFLRALLLCQVAFLSHLALDLPTSWGTLALYPASHRRFALDWVFIVDPMLWGLLLGGIGLGVRRAERFRRRAAAGGLLAAAAYLGLAGVAHALALGAAREAAGARDTVARTSSSQPPAGAAASRAETRQDPALDVFPLPLAPWRWHVVAWRGDSLEHLWLEGLPARVRETRSEAHGLDGSAARAALMTRPGQSFLWWSRAPVARVSRPEDDAIVVGLSDGRFAVRDEDPFGMEIGLGRDGRYLWATWQGEPVFGEGRRRANDFREPGPPVR